MSTELDPAAQSLAQALGANALAAFGTALPLLLLVVAGGWGALGRNASAGVEVAPPRLALRLVIGFVCIAAAAWVFAEIAEELGAGETMGRFDQIVSDGIAAHVPGAALQVFAIVTHLGDTATLTMLALVVAAVLARRRQRVLATAWLLSVGGNALLNTTLKSIFERARPVHTHGLAFETSWSFPSGHSSGALVAYGMLAYLAMCLLPRGWHLPVLLLATVVVFTTGCSRIFLQVHFLSDVAAGFASGSAWLAVCIVGCEWTRHRHRTRVAAG